MAKERNILPYKRIINFVWPKLARISDENGQRPTATLLANPKFNPWICCIVRKPKQKWVRYHLLHQPSTGKIKFRYDFSDTWVKVKSRLKIHKQLTKKFDKLELICPSSVPTIINSAFYANVTIQNVK